MEKIKTYGLYAKVEGTSAEAYTINEGKNNYLKRGQELMSHETFEDFDSMTSKFTSWEDINETFKEIYNSTKNMHQPVIYVDVQEENVRNMFYTCNIVYQEDAKELKNRVAIKQWLLDYLSNNPDDVSKFSGISEIYKNLKKKYPTIGIMHLINNTVKIYFNEESYIRYREAYFKLKELDYKRVKKDEIHR